MRLYLLRHGESENNVDLNIYKTKPSHEIKLTGRGIEQAKYAGGLLSRNIGQVFYYNPVFVYSSTYCRAYETAKIICSFLSHSVLRKDIILVEKNFGTATGCDSVESYIENISSQKDLFNKIGKFYYAFPQGESDVDLAVRAELFLNKILRKNVPNIIAVSHQMFCSALHSQIIGDYSYSEWNNCEIKYYDFKNNEPIFWSELVAQN